MRILILGSDGMLGHKLFAGLGLTYPGTFGTIRGSKKNSPLALYPQYPTDQILENVDARNPESWEDVIQNLRPDAVINCIGLIKQREAAQSRLECIQINAFFPHQLAAYCTKVNTYLIHFSTDCVFSGRRGNYLETDESDALDVYGKSKYLGEICTDHALTLRTSIIGRELSNYHGLLEWFLSMNHQRVKGFTRAIFSGVTTNYMLELVKSILTRRRMVGLYQAGGGFINKYDLLVKIRDAYGLDIEIIPDAEFHCDRSFSHENFEKETGIATPSWDEVIRELAVDPMHYLPRSIAR